MKENIIDVTILPPPMKHPTIFERFDALLEGESLTIYNDHDPKPLYYQLLHERGEVFDWTYQEEGPLRWVVVLERKQSAGKDTVGSIVASDWRKAAVFKKHGIDFCCGGKKTLSQVCNEKNLSLNEIESELRSSGGSSTRGLPTDDWELGFLADYIVNTHHAFAKKTLPELKAYAFKVAMVHGEFHPELKEIHELVEAIDTELTEHMWKEENILFPYVKELAGSKSAAVSSPFGSIANPIHVMEHEHDSAGKILQGLRDLSNGFTIPSDACASYPLLYRMLEEFELDMHTHIHLENNILFPKAIKLEQELISLK